jgi:hypothetical protein
VVQNHAQHCSMWRAPIATIQRTVIYAFLTRLQQGPCPDHMWDQAGPGSSKGTITLIQAMSYSVVTACMVFWSTSTCGLKLPKVQIDISCVICRGSDLVPRMKFSQAGERRMLFRTSNMWDACWEVCRKGSAILNLSCLCMAILASTPVIP